jgi:membrane protease YdiL (CAAX protease family)
MDTAPPPERPELPDGAERRPPWPPWYAGVGFVVGLFGTLIGVGILAAALGVGPDEESATFTIFATLLQNTIFIATALLFASMTAKPRPWHFGLNRTRFWPAVGWALLGLFAYYLFAATYVAVVDPDVEQGVTDALGADEGTFGLIVAGFMVVAVAPVAEELFFRGFFYRALRSRYSIVAAALIDGLLFGVIHYDFSGGDALLILPPLAALGFMFCLVYERTGSLFPVIALHAVNNAVAYAVQIDTSEAGRVSLALGATMIAACALVPRLLRPPPRAALA